MRGKWGILPHMQVRLTAKNASIVKRLAPTMQRRHGGRWSATTVANALISEGAGWVGKEIKIKHRRK